MRKILFLFSSMLMLQACSVLDYLPNVAPANTLPPTSTSTASLTPTITPTPTHTPTPTPRNTATLIISEFNTQVVFVTEGFAGAAEPSSVFAATPGAPAGGFESVELSQGHIYYGVCKPNYTKMTVKVERPEEVNKVYIFFRLESGKKPGDTTPWTGSITDDDGGGYYLYTLRANNIPEHRNFLKAWVHYQFVAADSNEKIIGRTEVYTQSLLLEPCK